MFYLETNEIIIFIKNKINHNNLILLINLMVFNQANKHSFETI